MDRKRAVVNIRKDEWKGKQPKGGCVDPVLILPDTPG
jgi:hypothetical protein